MFADMMAELARGEEPDPDRLRGRFRAALTKKLAVVRLPPCFWMNDPKINPRSDHLLWAALLLDDRQGVELVASAIAVELAERGGGEPVDLGQRLRTLADELLRMVPQDRRQGLRLQVDRLLATG